MAENTPSTPPGAVPPKPGEGAKVQPKKETVRISLPPKPTAAPTIKIPTPAAVASPAVSAAAAPAASAPAGAPPPPPAPRPAPSAPALTTAPSAAAAPRMAPSRASAAPTGLTMLDNGLAIAAAVLGAIALVRVLLLTRLFD